MRASGGGDGGDGGGGGEVGVNFSIRRKPRSTSATDRAPQHVPSRTITSSPTPYFGGTFTGGGACRFLAASSASNRSCSRFVGFDFLPDVLAAPLASSFDLALSLAARRRSAAAAASSALAAAIESNLACLASSILALRASTCCFSASSSAFDFFLGLGASVPAWQYWHTS